METDAPITFAEVKLVISNLKVNKSAGPDRIVNEILKHSQPVIINSIVKVFNLILKTGNYPDSWKLSFMIPLHKKGDKLDPNNYRGISLISNLPKIFNAILNNRLIKIVDKQLSDCQFGFRENHRTADSIFLLKSLINKYLHKEKKKIYACFIDLKKAFDSVWRTALLYKLCKMGVGKSFYRVIKQQYLNTKSSLKYKDYVSEYFNIARGVKQGDTLSPTLFNVFINDIVKNFEGNDSSPLKLINSKKMHSQDEKMKMLVRYAYEPSTQSTRLHTFSMEIKMLHVPIICLLLFSKTVFGSVPMSEFFSFGEDVNDTMLYPNDDGSSTVQNISTTFEFFSVHRKQLFVNTNGLLSFFQSIRKYTSEEFPKIGERIVLAPFWADIDTRRCGSTCSIWYRESTELVDISKATSEIRYFFPVMKHFNASWTYIATWINVPFFGASSLGMNKRNTFQAVLITDNKSTFVIYNYNKIEWTTGTSSQGNADTGLDGIPAQVGFNMGDEIHYYSVEGSRQSEIINLPHLSNVKYPGKFVFRVDLQDIESAPTPDADQCFLKAADILFVVDLSFSLDINDLKNLISDVVLKLPINAMECQIAMKSFSTSAKTEFRFKDHKTKNEILGHIAKMSTAKGVSNLKDALSSTTQMFSYNDGSRLYATRFIIIFTDGMAASRELKTQADHLRSFSNMIVATVGIGSSVKHDHLELISSDFNSILRPSANSFWNYLQSSLAVPGCLACKVDFGGEIRILLENSGSITHEVFKEGRQFIYTLIEELTSFNLSNVNSSVDIFSDKVTEAVLLQNISGMDYKLGGLSIVEHTENKVNQSLLVQHVKDIGITSSSNTFIIFISNGYFLDSHLIEKLKHSVNETSIIVSVGIGEDNNWDYVEDLATYGYFVYSSEDAHLLARYLQKEMKTTTCT
ncbi:uncharacterized protein [Mytilus edulis]|uniref:uncharacterized protein n=1 Tax=Mytilus edulis TaxID=6550 RepID=UPI0039EE3242